MRLLTLILLVLLTLLSVSRATEPSVGTGRVMKKAKPLALVAPKLQTPPKALRQGLSVSGTVLILVDLKTGKVTSATMEKSTGHKILDDAALQTFRKWRFRTDIVSKVLVPIRFSEDRWFY